MLDIVGEGMLQEWYQPSQHTIWLDARISMKILNLQLVLKQQALLMYGIHLEHLRLTKCLPSHQAFNDHKHK